MHRCEIFPPLSDHKLNHDVTGWLTHPDRLLLLLATIDWDLARLSDSFEAVAIGGLATLDLHAFDPCADKANLIDYLCLGELNCELLWEHACCQPV